MIDPFTVLYVVIGIIAIIQVYFQYSRKSKSSFATTMWGIFAIIVGLAMLGFVTATTPEPFLVILAGIFIILVGKKKS